MTAHKIVRITIDQLRPGMYVGNVFNDRGVLLYSANTLIVDINQIESLRRQGVVAVGINLRMGTGDDILPVEEPGHFRKIAPDSPSVQNVEVFDPDKLQKAVEIRTVTIAAVQEVMASAKTGRLFSLGTIADCAESILATMLDEPDLLLNLCWMRSASPSNYEHSVNVAVLMVGFASALGFSREKIIDTGIGGLLHDIGMVRLPEELLHRQMNCTRQEYELIKNHPALGLGIVESSHKKVPVTVQKVIAQHHERLNGSGYPAGLRGKQIDESALVCAIADMYDSLTITGIHARNYMPQEALALIFQGADDEYPRTMVEHFTKLLGIYPVGSFVKIDNGAMGVVVRNNRQKLLTPVVKVLFNEQGQRLETPYLHDLAEVSSTSSTPGVRITASLDPHSFNVTASDAIRWS